MSATAAAAAATATVAGVWGTEDDKRRVAEKGQNKRG